MNFHERIELTLLQPGKTYAAGVALVYVPDPSLPPIVTREAGDDYDELWRRRAEMVAPAIRRMFAPLPGRTFDGWTWRPSRLEGDALHGGQGFRDSQAIACRVLGADLKMLPDFATAPATCVYPDGDALVFIGVIHEPIDVAEKYWRVSVAFAAQCRAWCGEGATVDPKSLELDASFAVPTDPALVVPGGLPVQWTTLVASIAALDLSWGPKGARPSGADLAAVASSLAIAPCAFAGVTDAGARLFFLLGSPVHVSGAFTERRPNPAGGWRFIYGTDAQIAGQPVRAELLRGAEAWVPEHLRLVAHPYGGSDGRISLRAGSVWQFSGAGENSGPAPIALVNGAVPVTSVGRPAVAAPAPIAPEPAAWPTPARRSATAR